ncbi:MAG: type II toxin-antitoxin system RelE/ParE family toxin [Vicinamibacteria bacterium]
MKLRWSDRARQDLKESGRYIARDSSEAAREWVARLRRRAVKAAAIPRAGRIVPEFGRPEVREVLLGNYRLVYQVSGKTVTILTVFEGHRLLSLPELSE